MAKINIDFSIHSSPYYLKVVDLSNWGVIKNKPSIVEITLPGFANPVTKFFDKNKLNVFNVNTLDIAYGDSEQLSTLPDGVYKIKVIGSPDKYSREEFYLKTDLFDMEIDKVYIDNIDRISDVAFNEKLIRIEFLKKGAEAHLRSDMLEMTSMLFGKAQELLTDIINCSTCK
jgi:hypothetical protein